MMGYEKTGQTIAVSRNPANGELINLYPFYTSDQIEHALAENAAAAKTWRATPIAERVKCYRRLATALRDRMEHLAKLITDEMGKTLGASRAELEKCATALEWLAAHGPAVLADEPVRADSNDQIYVSFLPIGSVLGVMPWNFPFWQVIRAAGPIMLSGNGFVLKHA
jgi:succinate-semialdehyde dehydrogenase